MGLFFRTLHRYFQQYTRIKRCHICIYCLLPPNGFSDCFPCRDITDNFEPGMYQMGFASFFRYTIVLVLLHAFILNILDTFSLANMPTLLLKIASDTIVTLIFILCVDSVRRKKIVERNYDLEKRKYVIGGAVIVIVLIFLIRLLSLQIMSEDYKKNADSNAFLKKIQYPSRGVIYDRNEKLLVYNQAAYDITVIMKRNYGAGYHGFMPNTENLTGVSAKKIP